VKINSDINVLGSLPDWNLIKVFLSEDMVSIKEKGGIHTYTAIKTDKSVKRFEKAIKATLIQNKKPELETIIRQAIKSKTTSAETLLLLFWNASVNNELLFHLNDKVFFPAFYSGRVSIKNDEVVMMSVKAAIRYPPNIPVNMLNTTKTGTYKTTATILGKIM
jgi:hypothetical protein